MTVAAEDFGLGLWSTPDLFEENAYVPMIDTWVNQSDSTMPLSVSGEPAWKLRHIAILPPGALKLDWKLLVPREKLTLEIHYLIKGDLVAQGDVNDAGYLQFAERIVKNFYNYDTNELLTHEDNVGTVYTLGPDDLSATSDPTASNFTHVDQSGDPVWAASGYRAEDGKSINDYGRELTEADDETFYGVVNATAVGFAMEPEPLKDVIWFFDAPAGTTMVYSVDEDGQISVQSVATTLKRYRVYLHKKKFEKSYTSTDGGTMTTTKSKLVSILNAMANLETVPSGAKQYHYNGIGSTFLDKKIGVAASMNGVKKVMMGFIAILGLTGLILLLGLIFFRKRLMRFLRRIFNR